MEIPGSANALMDKMFLNLEKCELCPRRCKVNRTKGEKGYCTVGDSITIAHYGPHFGEEPPISGAGGSGNIFFASCNLRCIYCQNYQISHRMTGVEYSVEGLADIFFSLQEQGVHNINLVSPTPYVPFIVAAIREAKRRGLAIPFLYNSNAYENKETIRLLDGLIDIYLPDFKYWNQKIGSHLSDAEDYPRWAKAAIMEMKAQVGNLIIEDGIAKRGLLVRHLVLPNNLAGSREVMGWIRENLGTETFLSIMSQYFPIFRVSAYPMLNRRITEQEYNNILSTVTEYGFENVYIQELESAPLFVPDFNREAPF
ncbi:MAG: radical SAM protein [Syntrophus sp. (in: bacteria)]|nr:radical SAM protein [Syntrophus sp. (in: bacteria)]